MIQGQPQQKTPPISTNKTEVVEQVLSQLQGRHEAYVKGL
jgi:hypothetical protein